MKVLIHSNGPHVPSGYGKQARHAGRILRDLGHEVAFSCFSGLGGQPIRWDGYTLFPNGRLAFGVDTVVPHALTYGADLVIPIMDVFKLEPCAVQLRQVRDEKGIRTAAFTVTDCTAENGGPSVPDQRTLAKSGAYPVAVSQFGLERLAAAMNGWSDDTWADASYVPHCVDTTVYKPPADKAALRAELGVEGDFIIGIMAANRDVIRKGFAEQMAAFARFARMHAGARLALFTVARGELDLTEIAADMGISDRVIFMPWYEQDCGLLPEHLVSAWYGTLDVLSLCSYAEGFGVPLIEAQACGIPVVATDGSAMTELTRPAGYLVKGTRIWNPAHRAWWTRPDENAIVKAWERAWQESHDSDRPARAAAFAQRYSVERVRDDHWAPFMKRMEDTLLWISSGQRFARDPRTIRST